MSKWFLFALAGVMLAACTLPTRDEPAVATEESRSEDQLAKARADLTAIKNACLMFKLDQGRFPASVEELVEPDDRGRKYLAELPVDPWSKAPYRVARTETGLRIWTLGRDQEEGGTGVDADLIAEV